MRTNRAKRPRVEPTFSTFNVWLCFKYNQPNVEPGVPCWPPRSGAVGGPIGQTLMPVSVAATPTATPQPVKTDSPAAARAFPQADDWRRMLTRRAAKAAPRPGPDQPPASLGHTPTRPASANGGDPLPTSRELAIELARRLGDYASLKFFMKFAAQLGSGRLCQGLDPTTAARMVLDKARELGALKQPFGPIHRPAAAFVAWVKKTFPEFQEAFEPSTPPTRGRRRPRTADKTP